MINADNPYIDARLMCLFQWVEATLKYDTKSAKEYSDKYEILVALSNNWDMTNELSEKLNQWVAE